MRFTTRRLMIFVAVVALGLVVLRTAMWILNEIEEAVNEPFAAVGKTARSWDLGPTPFVIVDCFEGTIQVLPGTDGRVTAEVTSAALAEDHRSTAIEGLKTIEVDFQQHGDTLRVVARGASESMVRKDAGVTLHVPSNVRLDLRTGRGEIRVGRDYSGNNAIHDPIAAYSIRARNDSKYRLGYAEGNVIVETTAPRGPDGKVTPTRLQLDAPGQIEVIADRAAIEAYAWHGTPHPSWTHEAYEDGQEGIVRFEGTLAEGDQQLRAAHRVEVKLAGDPSIRIDAAADGSPTRPGSIAGDALDSAVRQSGDEARWSGRLGSGAGGTLSIRVDDGSISLNRKP